MSPSHPDVSPLSPPSPLGFVGLGRMGAAMAHRLLEAGFPLLVHNRDRAKAAPLVAAGAEEARELAEFARVSCVITMLADDRAVEDVVLAPGGLADALKPGAVHLEASTIGVGLSRRLADEHRGRGDRKSVV